MLVDVGGAHGGWVEKVHQEAQLKEVVEWNELENDSCELVDDVEGTKTHPVGEPLLVIFHSLRLKSNETHEGWVGNSNDIGNV